MKPLVALALYQKMFWRALTSIIMIVAVSTTQSWIEGPLWHCYVVYGWMVILALANYAHGRAIQSYES